MIDPIPLVAFVPLLAIALFLTGLLPIPVGYDRGKIAWLNSMSEKSATQYPEMAYLLCVGFGVMVFFGRAEPTLMGILYAGVLTIGYTIIMSALLLTVRYGLVWWGTREGVL